MHLSCCVSEPYNGLIETYFVHIAACPILKSPAQDHFKKIWVSRENIKVTLIKGQNQESRREKKLGMLVLLGEASAGAELQTRDLDREERTASRH